MLWPVSVHPARPVILHLIYPSRIIEELLLPDFDPRNDNRKTNVQVGLLTQNFTCWLDVTKTGLRQDFK